mgnify:CR=1 FL=1
METALATGDAPAAIGAIDRVGALWAGTNKGAVRIWLDSPRSFFGAAHGLAGAQALAEFEVHGTQCSVDAGG